ncbi:MAG: hypothetical protein NZL93_04360, partial [Chthoniobacterales bacterium]|nr:hypothetical protein [Chthoniobacterales bacterium]
MPTPPNQIYGYHGSFSALVLTQDPQSDDPALLVRAILSSSVVNTLNQINASLQLLDDIVKYEDAVHVSGDAGVQALAVRNDTPAALASNGDYIPLTTDSTGRLWTNALVTNTLVNPVIVDLPFVTYQE